MKILAIGALASAFAMPLALAGCSNACDDLKACCEAVQKKLNESAMGGITVNLNCAAYDEADSDACESAKDSVKSAGGSGIPECDF
jgi:hypothetical protein